MVSLMRLALFISLSFTGNTQYQPTWESLDTRPLPEWYDEAKFGIMIHWGLYSVPSFGGEWFWAYWKGHSSSYVEFMNRNYHPNFTYQDFGREFTTEFYNPEDWADLFQASGAKYVVLTTKHHEGFTMWPSTYSFGWNSKDLGSNRDLVGDLATAIRNKTDLHFGVYYSLYEWYHPLYMLDKKNKYETQNFVHGKCIPELHELVNRYYPDVIWSDGDWEGSVEYWQSREFLAWLYNESPVKDTVVVNDRWGPGIPCKHGDFLVCYDRWNPGVLQPFKWEGSLTIDKSSWGYRRNARLKDYMTTSEMLKVLIMVVSCGGNLLMNISPTKDGLIPIIFQERLQDVGSWLKINGEGIYASKPWMVQNDTTEGVWYTQKGDNSTIYAHILNWPTSGNISLGAPVLSENSEVTMLGVEGVLLWTQAGSSLNINFPNKVIVKTDWAWVLKITNVTARWSNLWQEEERMLW